MKRKNRNRRRRKKTNKHVHSIKNFSSGEQISATLLLLCLFSNNSTRSPTPPVGRLTRWVNIISSCDRTYRTFI